MGVIGHTSYEGLIAQQHEDVFQIFKEFLEDIKPARILEIGTAGGGLTLFLRHILPKVPILTFEVLNKDYYQKLKENNIEVRIENIFNHAYNALDKPEAIESFIQQEGTTLVLCDGGHKIGEFNAIAPLIKEGDFIMAHDYIRDNIDFQEKFKDKIWDWCEIEEKHIEEISNQLDLVHYNQNNFSKVVWVCKRRRTL
jgi:cephalosporin hydroxylase